MLIKQSTAVAPLLFLMVDSSDHITGKTGLAPTVTISKNGGAFATPAGAVTELSGGWYKIAANATDSNTLGQIAIHATASGADPCDDKSYEIVAFNPQSATDLGLSTLTSNVPQTGDAYAIVNDAAFGNAKLVRSTTPANTLSVNNVGAIISVVDVTGSITGNLGGKVLGGGDSDITGVGAWVLDGTGAAVPTASANAAGLLDLAAGVETGLTLRQALRGVVAALFGKVSGGATTTVAFRDQADTKDRISATVDAEGNRSAITKDLT